MEMIRQKKINGNKLPSEEELTKLIGVSLATLREALQELNAEGIISKRHGSGNFIHQSALTVRMRIDRYSDFIHLLRDGGYEAKATYSPMRLEKADEAVATALNIKSGSKVVVYEKIFWVDGKIAIHAQNRISYQNFVKDIEMVEEETDLATLIWRYCRKDLAQGIQEFIPTVLQEEDVELFGLPKGTPMTSWKETFYTVEDMPICLSWVKFNPVLVKMTTLWKWGQKS